MKMNRKMFVYNEVMKIQFALRCQLTDMQLKKLSRNKCCLYAGTARENEQRYERDWRRPGNF